MILKTGVMMLKIQLCITALNYILLYICIEAAVLNCNIIYFTELFTVFLAEERIQRELYGMTPKEKALCIYF